MTRVILFQVRPDRARASPIQAVRRLPDRRSVGLPISATILVCLDKPLHLLRTMAPNASSGISLTHSSSESTCCFCNPLNITRRSSNPLTVTIAVITTNDAPATISDTVQKLSQEIISSPSPRPELRIGLAVFLIVNPRPDRQPLAKRRQSRSYSHSSAE